MYHTFTHSHISSYPGSKGTKVEPAEELKEHRHWQSVFDFLIQTFHIAHKNQPRPEGMRLGGQVTLQGRQALLACFHGLNFRSSSWALFTLREPKLEFETEALQIPSTEHCESPFKSCSSIISSEFSRTLP